MYVLVLPSGVINDDTAAVNTSPKG